MTRDHHHRSAARRPRRIVRIGLVALTGFVAVSTVGGSAEAERRTKSAVIAGAAAQAIDALESWNETANPADYVRFVRLRDQAASMTEVDIEIADGSLRGEWAAAPIVNQQVVLNAVSQLGVPYRRLGSEQGVGFDCSGLTTWAFGEVGMVLPRISRDQINDAEAIDRAEAVPGDLAYYPGHVSIFIGAGLMVHSPNSGSHVEVTWLPERSLRFGNATSAFPVIPAPAATTTGETSLVNRALTVPQ
jgi:peptidoglycan DL-endopeptidase CwlO